MINGTLADEAIKASRAERLKARLRGLSTATKALLSIWVLFLLLVAFGIHGSSTGVLAGWWAPEKPYTGYLFNPPQSVSKNEAEVLQDLLMARARWIRWDELMISTPLSLSQLSHNPRFPVVNTNIANGQNMLTVPHTPVWHVVTLARPATWGYFFLGGQRGLAWYWWFRVFACFTVLYLLLEVILKGHRGLAAFGAFWFCASAYVVCWSLWPAQVAFFAALGCLAAYRLLASEKKSAQIIWAILLGLSIPGFIMILYPPQQVSVGYLFLLVFGGLVVRDKLYVSAKSILKNKWLPLTVALLLAGGLTFSFVVTCLPDLEAMSNTVYPGKRFSLGGDYSFAFLFEGMYNLITIYKPLDPFGNQTEASSFYYLFPAAFLTICLSRRLATRLGVLGWLLVSFLIGMLFFLLIGLPEAIAKLTLMSYVPSNRADLAIGLASIILCVYVLALGRDLKKDAQTRWSRIAPWLVSGVIAVLFTCHGLVLMKVADGFPSLRIILIVALLTAFLSYCLVAGRTRLFCGALGAILVATTAVFNPLATNLDHIYHSELAEQIVRLNRESSDRPLWITYGGVQPGMLITTLGGRSLTGVHWPPQLALWRSLDPTDGAYEKIYNRFAQVQLIYRASPSLISFRSSQEDALDVYVAPDHPALKRLGVRYVLAMGDSQQNVGQSALDLVYKSSNGSFSIFAERLRD
ncbi:MAG: hypothetical protein AABO41_27435 [Acidobacteriota bacterium]